MAASKGCAEGSASGAPWVSRWTSEPRAKKTEQLPSPSSLIAQVVAAAKKEKQNELLRLLLLLMLLICC
jgi:hypothetical protein